MHKERKREQLLHLRYNTKYTNVKIDPEGRNNWDKEVHRFLCFSRIIYCLNNYQSSIYFQSFRKVDMEEAAVGGVNKVFTEHGKK